jgi:HAMP domain-containing protein/HPt (histidine-containing phosphotransfer) domain-containing protein
MARLGIAQKLWLVCLSFGVPIVVMFVLMVSAKLEQVNFAEQELAGTTFLRPLVEVLEYTTAYRAASPTTEEPERQRRAQAAAGLASALARLDTQQRKLGERLQFDAAGLGLRGRGAFTAQQLRSEWQGVVSTGSRAAYERLLLHVRTMVTHAGDSSNLILDPDLDTYYMMDAVLLALPALEAHLASVLADLDVLPDPARPPSESASSQLVLDAAFIEQAEWGRALASLAAAQTEDANFFGSSPTLRPALESLSRQADARARQLLDAMRRSASSPSQDSATLAALRGEIVALSSDVHRLHRVALAELDVLLQMRIAALMRRLWLGCALAFLSIAVAAVAAMLLARAIVRRIARIASATQAFASGDLGARVGQAGDDELGRLAASFDGMAARISGLSTEVRARADELATLNQSLERTVEARTRELVQRNAEFRLIFDVAHDGMLTIDLTGLMSSERSAAVERMLGMPGGVTRLQDYALPHDPEFASALSMGLAQVEADELPLELTLSQLPARMYLLAGVQNTGEATLVRAKKRTLRVLYQPIFEGSRVTRLLVILTDISAELLAAQGQAEQAEALRIFHACQRDHGGFLSFLLEGRELVQQIAQQGERGGVELTRALHTLKGICGLFGVLSVAGLCHELEFRIADGGGELSTRDVTQLVTAWDEMLALASQFVGDHAARTLEVSEAEYASLLDDIARGKPRAELLTEISTWKLEPVERRFKRFGDQAQSVAKRLGKALQIKVEANGLRVSEQSWAPMWGALVHVIRNSVDHGIESGELRLEKGKPAEGTLSLRSYVSEREFVLEVADDGRGVDWQKLAEKAQRAGLAHQSRAELVEALFADGVSTRDEVTQLSGRGVGMAAVRQACLALGGRIEIESAADQGTTVRCSFPKQAMNPEQVAAPRVIFASLPDARWL